MDMLGQIIIERLSSFRGKNVLPLYRLVHQKVSFIQRCPLFRVSFIRGSTVLTPYRHVWDKTLVSSWRVATIDPQTEVFQYVTRSSPPHCDRDHCLLRAWHRDVPTGRYVVASTSVSHPLAELRAGVRVVHLASHFLLTPATHSGGGTQVTAICREDWR